MYVPEEVAFRLYCRLMDDPASGGAGLRRFYAPGLEPLKLELSVFELLLASHLPDLAGHLQAAGLPAVLYASQWFMTLFASPFPLHFGGRVLDALLQVGRGEGGGGGWQGGGRLGVPWFGPSFAPCNCQPDPPIKPHPSPPRQSASDGVLLRVALALMEALQGELLAHDDFESIITAVKVGRGEGGTRGGGGAAGAASELPGGGPAPTQPLPAHRAAACRLCCCRRLA
jgi:hypothetical protein